MSPVAYQGVPGAFSEEAARRFAAPGEALMPCDSFEKLFDAVESGAARCGAAPVENTLAGPVLACWDPLTTRNVRVTAETIVAVSHALVGVPGATLEGVRRVLSHPVALQQCERFFRANPRIEAVPVFDTAGAVRQVTRAGDPAQAALAAERTAALYEGVVLARALEDFPNNLTRFFCIAGAGASGAVESAGASGAPGAAQLAATPLAATKSVLFLRTANRPGALWRALRPFAERGLDLTRIESRPVRHTPFEYAFLLEVAAAQDPEGLDAAVGELRAESLELRELGRFTPAGPFSRATADGERAEHAG